MKLICPFRTIVAQSADSHSDIENERPYRAELNLYMTMAFYVAKMLKLDPNVILDEWSVPSLIVAFGEYANSETATAYESWKNNPNRKLKDKPQEYIVQFIGLSQMYG